MRRFIRGDALSTSQEALIYGERVAGSRAISNSAMPPCAEQPLLLPLTSSLYVKGKVADTEKVLVNIGTDYYVEVRCRAGHCLNVLILPRLMSWVCRLLLNLLLYVSAGKCVAAVISVLPGLHVL